jgi:glyoxylase-like metal-dependent hydrolase (beta-lactamase superfamily II)
MALAEASRLTQPLEGGVDGATVVLHPLNSGDIKSPTELMAMTGGTVKALRSLRSSRDEWITIPIPAFLVEHPGVGPILIDTGLHASVAVDPKQNMGPVIGRLYNFEMTPEQTIAAQLRNKLGIEPAQVKVVVMTHLHMDHTSAMSDFTNATYVLGEGEWSAFRAPRPTMHGYVRKHAELAVDFREVVYDTRIVGSYSTFGRSFDLFGDGSVRLVYTPGHSAGHQSVILRLGGREVLVAGDAIYFLATLEHERRGLFLADEHQWRRSLREVQLYRRENPDALIIPSHDGELWSRLESRYE